MHKVGLNAMIEADNRIVVSVNQTQAINPASAKKLQAANVFIVSACGCDKTRPASNASNMTTTKIQNTRKVNNIMSMSCWFS